MFEERVSVRPLELTRLTGDLNDLIIEKLQGKLEGKCARNGYVIPGSLKLISRSMGMVEKGTFTGDWIFIVQAEGRVIYPPDGIVIEGTVNRKNKAGIYIIYKDAVRIMVPRDLYVGDEEYENIMVGDKIQVEIKKSRFQVNDKEILSIGLFRGKATGGPTVEDIEKAEEEAGEEEEAAGDEEEEEEEGDATNAAEEEDSEENTE